MSQEDSPDGPKYGPKYGLSALAITSMLLLAAAASVIGWLALGAGEYQDRFGRPIPVVILPLPPAESVAAENIATEIGAPAQPVEPGPPLAVGDGAREGAPEPAELSPPAGPKETAKASPEAPPNAPLSAPQADGSEKSLAEIPEQKPKTPAPGATPPGRIPKYSF